MKFRARTIPPGDSSRKSQSYWQMRKARNVAQYCYPTDPQIRKFETKLEHRCQKILRLIELRCSRRWHSQVRVLQKSYKRQYCKGRAQLAVPIFLRTEITKPTSGARGRFLGCRFFALIFPWPPDEQMHQHPALTCVWTFVCATSFSYLTLPSFRADKAFQVSTAPTGWFQICLSEWFLTDIFSFESDFSLLGSWKESWTLFTQYRLPLS